MEDSGCEPLYCSQQIIIPLNLPYILKEYAKAAIRTQPYDLLLWSATYFKCLSEGQIPPVKERFEYPPIMAPSGLSPGFLKVLIKQYGKKGFMDAEKVKARWLGITLKEEGIQDIFDIIGIQKGNIRWLNFIAVATGYLCPTLKDTMIMLCELLTDDPDGGPATIPLELFLPIYKYLSRLDCRPISITGSEELLELFPPRDASVQSIITTECMLAHGMQINELDDLFHVLPEEGYDSNAGLMVWENVQPPTQRSLTPRPSEEGKTSEQGLMVYDGVTDSITPSFLTDEEALNYTFDKEAFNNASPEERKQMMIRYHQIQARRQKLKDEQDALLPEQLTDEEFVKHVKETDEKLVQKKKEVDQEHITDLLEGVQKTSDAYDYILYGRPKPEIPARKKIKNKIYTVTDTYEILSVEEVTDMSKFPQVDLPETCTDFTKLNEEVDCEISESSEDEEVNVFVKIGDSFLKLEPNEEWVEVEDVESFYSPDPSYDVPQELVSYTVRRLVKRLKSETEYETPESKPETLVEEEAEEIEYIEPEKTPSIVSVNIMRGKTRKEIQKGGAFNLIKDLRDDLSMISSPEEGVHIAVHIPGIGPTIPEEQIEQVITYMTDMAKKQDGYVMPRNIRHFLCPPIDLAKRDGTLEVECPPVETFEKYCQTSESDFFYTMGKPEIHVLEPELDHVII